MRAFSLVLFLFFAITSKAEEYFQQEVNYHIEVLLDDSNHFLHGFETIEYTNNSSDTLHFLWFHLWPNAYKNNNTALAKQFLKNGTTNFYFSDPEQRGYIDSINFLSNNTFLNWKFHDEHIDIAKVELASPLHPGEKIEISTPFRVKIPLGIYSRLGHINQQYQITQWYPKPAVYDKKGWHPMPYLNQGEFFSEFGMFEVKITLPENYRVAASGELQESSEIYWLDSLARKTKYIEDYPQDNTFPSSSKTYKTITYRQNNIHDFAWFADKRYHVLKGESGLSTSEKKITTWVFFTNRNARYWQNSIEYLNDALFYYSKWNGEYPYNVCTAVDGALSAGGGMEYPTITVIGDVGTAKDLETVIMHEVGHNWFYGILASNEREFPWLDEGLNTLNEIRYNDTKHKIRFHSNKLTKILGIDSMNHFDEAMLFYKYVARLNLDQPINTSSSNMLPINYGVITYQKTGAMFTYLKNIYGEQNFDEAMQQYFRQYKFKHPYPEDLIKTLEESFDKNLNWFAKDILNSTKKMDYAFAGIKKTKTDSFKITLKNKGHIAAPFYLYYSDSSKVFIPGFEKKQQITLSSKKKLRIGDAYFPDIYPKNNKPFFQKELKFSIFPEIEHPSKHQLYLSPTIGWNNYNKTMLGIAIHNITIPHKKLEFIINPMFGLDSRKFIEQNKPIGFGEIAYYILPRKEFSRVNLSSTYSSFAMPSAGIYNKGVFFNWKNSINASFQKLKPQGTQKTTFNLSGIYIEEFYFTSLEPAINIEPFSNNNFFLTGGFDYSLDKTINVINGNISFEGFKDFLKISTEANLFHQYHRRGHVNFRVFMGAFAFNNSNFARYNWQMDGRSGLQDYLYSEIFLDRGGREAVLSRQFIDTEGGFKVPTAVGQSNEWITSANLKTKLPFRFPLGFYVNAGIYPNSLTSNVNLLYDAGVYIPIFNDFINIYFPLSFSESIKNYHTINQINFAETIRFTMNLKSLNPILLRENVLF